MINTSLWLPYLTCLYSKDFSLASVRYFCTISIVVMERQRFRQNIFRIPEVLFVLEIYEGDACKGGNRLSKHFSVIFPPLV